MSMHAEPVIAVGGENLIDSVHAIAPDGTPTVAHNLGGSPYNVAVALARQEARVHYLSPISEDDFGQQLADNLARQGVTCTGGRRAEPTTRAVVTLNNGVPSYVFHRDATAERAVTADSIKTALPEAAVHLHTGSLAFAGGADAAAWEDAFHSAATKGMTTSLDPNVRASLIDDPTTYRARIMRLLRSATIVKLSDEDLDWLYPDLSQDEAISNLRAATPASLVALTKGPEGAACWTPSLHQSIANPPLPDLKDTIGAGDTFMATTLAHLSAQSLLSGAALSAMTETDLQALLKRGVYAACLNCCKEGCDPPTTPALDTALREGI